MLDKDASDLTLTGKVLIKKQRKPFLPIRLTIFSDVEMKGNAYTGYNFLTKANKRKYHLTWISYFGSKLRK